MIKTQYGLVVVILSAFVACTQHEYSYIFDDDAGMDSGIDTVCPTQIPDAKFRCNKSMTCTYDPGYHVDCGLTCPKGCRGGGMYAVRLGPAKATCDGDTWTVIYPQKPNVCDKTPERDCICSDASASSDSGL
jgi:hypothetical protein